MWDSLRSNSDEPLGRDFTLIESVNRYSVARIAGSFALRIRNGANRSVKVMLVATECQPQEKALAGIFPQALIWKVCELVSGKVDHFDGLADPVCLSTVTVVEQYGIPSIGTKTDGGGKPVHAAELAEQG